MHTEALPPSDTDPDCPRSALSRAQATAAVERLLRNVARLRTRAADRYPLYALDGNWAFSRRGSWTPGYWAGLLRLTARITGDRTDRLAAAEATDRLAARLDDDTVTRSMTFWYGAGPDRPDLTREAARRLLATALPERGVIPVGTAWGRGEQGRREIEVDCWGPLVRLLAWSAPESGPEARGAMTAQRAMTAQTKVCLDGCLPLDEPPRIVERLTAGPRNTPPRPATSPTSAPRPAAWALLGLAESAAALNGVDASLAERCAVAAERLTRTRPSGDAPTHPTAPTSAHTAPDTSADAITAVALHKLAPHHHPAARSLTARLVREHLGPDGAFPGTRYRVADDRVASVESVWGTFHLLLALAIEVELIAPGGF